MSGVEPSISLISSKPFDSLRRLAQVALFGPPVGSATPYTFSFGRSGSGPPSSPQTTRSQRTMVCASRAPATPGAGFPSSPAAGFPGSPAATSWFPPATPGAALPALALRTLPNEHHACPTVDR